MKKRWIRGQVSVFIIVGVLVIAAIVIIVFASSLSRENPGGLWPFKSEMDSVKDSIVQCGKDNARSALKRVGVQGGYYNKPADYEDLGWAFIPYYYDRGNYSMPDKVKIESELGSYVDDGLDACLNDVYFKNYQIQYPESKTKVTILPKNVKFVVDLPVTITKDDKITLFELKDNQIVYNSSLYGIYEIADFITKTHKENASKFCVNCVTDMAKERNVYVDFIDYQDSRVLVQLSENLTYKEPYLFEFLNRY